MTAVPIKHKCLVSLAAMNQIETNDKYDFLSGYLSVTQQPPGLCLLVFLSSMRWGSTKLNSSSRIFIQLSKIGKTRRKLCFCLHPCRPRQWGWRCRCEAWPLDGSLPRTPVSTFSAFDRCCVEAEKLAILIRKYITRTTIQYIKSDRMKFAGNDLFVNGKQLRY